MHNHQAWIGGYHDHIEDVMNIGIKLYETLSILRDLPFTLSDLLLSIFFHDLEKPWKYEVGEDGKRRHRKGFDTKLSHHEFRIQKMKEYGIVVSEKVENGIKYAEGELSDYSNTKRTMNELAALTHMCDVCSARLFPLNPKTENDGWKN